MMDLRRDPRPTWLIAEDIAHNERARSRRALLVCVLLSAVVSVGVVWVVLVA